MNAVVAVVPISVMMTPFPISRGPGVIDWSAPISRAMHVIRAIADPNGDFHCVNGRHRNPAHTKQNREEQY